MNNLEQNSSLSLNDNLDVVYRSLYLPVLTEYIEQLILAYVEAYHNALSYYVSTPNPDPERVKELELLSGPMNEIFNPNNPRLDGSVKYPAVELIAEKVEEYSSGLDKGFTRTLKNPNAAGVDLNEELKDLGALGYFNIMLIFFLITISSIFLGCLLFILK